MAATVLRRATGLLAVFGAVAATGAAPAQQRVGSSMELGGEGLSLAPQEMRALSELGKLVASGQRGFQDRALAEARRVANSRDARYVLALYELEIGKHRDDDVLRAGALDVLIASSLTKQAKLPNLLGARGQIAYRAGDFAMAGRLWARWAELAPSDPQALANLAQVRLAQKDAPGAFDLLSRAIAARAASGQTPSAVWYRQRLSIAQQGTLVAPGIDAAKALVSAYPTPEHWLVALVVYRQLAAPHGALEIDILRLMRHVGALTQAAEYLRMAQLLNQAGEAGEAKAVLDEGASRGLLDAGTSPTREIIAEVARATLKARAGPPAKPAVPDAAGGQVRLGVAALLGGRRADAEAAFRVAQGDPAGGGYADLAGFWLIRVAQEPVGAAGTR